MQLETPSNVLVVGRHMPLLRRLIQGLADDHENGIVVSIRPAEFYQMAPKLHIQNCFRHSFVRNLLVARKQRLSGPMYVVWDEILEGTAEDPLLRSLLTQNQELGLTNVVVSAQPASWMMPQFDLAIVSPGMTAMGITVPVDHIATVDLSDLRLPTSKILSLD